MYALACNLVLKQLLKAWNILLLTIIIIFFIIVIIIIIDTEKNFF